MAKIALLNGKKEAVEPLRNVPNILTHRIANMRRVEMGEKPINFWDTVPDLLKAVKKHAKKNKEPLYVMKEKVEITLTIGAVKGVEYVY